MSVLRPFIEERATWTAQQEALQNRQHLRAAIGRYIFLGIGVLAVLKFHAIMAEISSLLGW